MVAVEAAVMEWGAWSVVVVLLLLRWRGWVVVDVEAEAGAVAWCMYEYICVKF